MPKRIVDGDALWRSRKLCLLEPRFRPEYANLLPLAFSNGSFECDSRLVWSRVYAFNRPDWTAEMVGSLLDALESAQMLFRWTAADGKRWGYFVGIDKSGRLPGPARRGKNEVIGEEPPRDLLAKFLDPHTDAIGVQTDTNGVQTTEAPESCSEDRANALPNSVDANGIHTDTNGRLGFGFGLGSVMGSGEIDSALSAVAYEPVPEEDDEEWTRNLAALHPSLENPEETYRAIFDALCKVMRDRKATKQEAKAYLWQRVERYRQITDGYPEDQKKYIKGSHTFFAKGCYAESDEVWLRRGRGNADGNGNRAEQRKNANVDAFKQFVDDISKEEGAGRGAPDVDGGSVRNGSDDATIVNLRSRAFGPRRQLYRGRV